jgi:hypothetical protein
VSDFVETSQKHLIDVFKRLEVDFIRGRARETGFMLVLPKQTAFRDIVKIRKLFPGLVAHVSSYALTHGIKPDEQVKREVLVGDHQVTVTYLAWGAKRHRLNLWLRSKQKTAEAAVSQ